MKALLVIDMQKGCFPSLEDCHDALGVIERINALSGHFRANGDPVIFVQHDASYENCLVPGSSDYDLLEQLTRDPLDQYIQKKANDAFYNTTLNELLENKGIRELYITGYSTDFCVDATIKSAHTKDFQVTVIADAHTTESKAGLPAAHLVYFYNQVWSAMAPTSSTIKVTRAEDVYIKEVEQQ